MPIETSYTSNPDSCPRLCRDLAVVELEGGLLVEGGPQRHIFRGRAATEVLPRLLPLLDGSRDPVALADQLALTQGQVEQVLGLLRERGLIESAGPSPAWPPTPTLGWFSRNLPEAGGYGCAEEILTVLAETTVLIAGCAAVAQALARDVLGSGVARAVVIGPDDRGPAESAAGLESTRSVAVVIEGRVDEETVAAQLAAVDRLAAWAGSASVPLLHVAFGRDHVELGPISIAGFSACPACVRGSRAEDGPRSAVSAASGIADLAAGLAAAEVLALAARLPGSADPRSLTRVSCTDWTTEKFWVVPYQDCDTCGVWAGAGASELPAREALIDLYEWSVQDRPVPESPGRELPPWEMRRIQELKAQRPRSPTLPRRALPPAVLPISGEFGADPTTAAHDPSPLDEALWATLLRQTAGVRSSEDGSSGRRWTACGGGLGSVEPYLLDERGFPGLPGTIFRYDDLAHSLVAVRDDHIRLTELLRGTGLEGTPNEGSATGVRAAVVLVAAHARLAAKYRNFAYRLAHLDAGCASTQLATVARAHGLEVEFATHWDTGVAEVLGLARDDQFVTAVAVLSRQETTCR